MHDNYAGTGRRIDASLETPAKPRSEKPQRTVFKADAQPWIPCLVAVSGQTYDSPQRSLFDLKGIRDWIGTRVRGVEYQASWEKTLTCLPEAYNPFVEFGLLKIAVELPMDSSREVAFRDLIAFTSPLKDSNDYIDYAAAKEKGVIPEFIELAVKAFGRSQIPCVWFTLNETGDIIAIESPPELSSSYD